MITVINQAALAMMDWMTASGLGGPPIPTASGAPAVRIARDDAVVPSRPLPQVNLSQALNQLAAVFSSAQSGSALAEVQTAVQRWQVAAAGIGFVGGLYVGGPLAGVAVGAAAYMLTGIVGMALPSVVNAYLNGHASLNDVTSPTMSDLQTHVQDLGSNEESMVDSVDDPTLTSFAAASESYSATYFGDQDTTGFEEDASDNLEDINDYFASSPVPTPIAPRDEPVSDGGWFDA